MSYMTPYYFSSSISQSLSIWMLSYDFAPKFGLALSGSTTKITESFSGSAWQYSSSFAGTSIRYTTPSTAVYMVEATSIDTGATGSFQLYITAAETSSIVTSNQGTPIRLVYSPNADRIFSAEWRQYNSPVLTCSLSVINPQTNAITNTFEYYDTVMMDVVYNSQADRVYLWVSSSAGEFLDGYDGSGSALIHSLPVTTSWVGYQNDTFGQMVYNQTTNQVLLLPSTDVPNSWSVYDFASATNVSYGLPPYKAKTAIYASSTNYYYAFPWGESANSAIKIDGSTYSSSIVTHMTGSGYGAAYISQVDRIFYQDDIISQCAVYNPSTDDLVAKIPGVFDLQFAEFDTCKNCIVISDDAAGDSTYSRGGGLCYVATSSYLPLNFIHMYGVYAMTYCSSTSTIWVGNYNNNEVQAIISSVGTSSLPQPPYPPSASLPLSLPINLMVTSGSAILDWQISGSLTPDYYEVYRSTTGEAGPYTQVTTSLNTHSVDRNVDINNTYWYKVKGIALGGSTSSFSNEAAIDLINCNKAAFDPIVDYGYLSYSSGSTYRNIYGKLIPFTSSVSQSISVWGRSPDFDVYLTLVDSNGNILIENDYDGWSPSGDTQYPGDAAFTYNLLSGSYNIEISSNNNAIGRYSLTISPGPKLETTWSNAYETSTIDYIPTSDWVVVGEQGSNIVFFDTITGEQKIHNYPIGTYGSVYSPAQDSVFAKVYFQVGGVYTASIVQYDNTGSYVGQTDYPRPQTVASAGSTLSQTGNTIYLHTGGVINDFTTQAESGSRIWFNDQSVQGIITSILNADTASVDISQTITYDPDFFDFGTEFLITRPAPFGTVDFNGYMSYDKFHDRILFTEYNWQTNQQVVVWECASKTASAELNISPYTYNRQVWTSCYCESNNSYYISNVDYFPMVKIDAATFAITNSIASSDVIVTYISESNMLMTRGSGNPGKVRFINPTDDTLAHEQSDLPTTGLFECAGVGDVCANVYVVGIDPGNGPNFPALALLDRNTYLPTNYLVLNSNDTPFNQGWYQYSMAISKETSRVYSAQVDYDNYEGRVYSIIPSRAFAPIESPYTSSASDTSSCMTFKEEFVVTASGVTRATAEFVCSSKITNSLNTMVVSDIELNEFFNGQHNFNNYFLSSSGQYLGNYTSSYIHTYSGKNSVFCNGKFYMLSDGFTEQSVAWEPVSGSSMLVFDQTGSFLSSIPLTYGARDWCTDGAEVFIYEIDTANSCWVEKIDPTTDTISATNIIQLGYDGNFYNATASLTASTNYTQGEKEFPYFGKMFAFTDSGGGTYTYYNNMYGKSGFSTTVDIPDTGSGDRIWGGGYTGYALYYTEMINMGQGSGYTKWCGSAGFCPINDHVYFGAVDINDNPVIVETTKNLGFVNTHSISNEIKSIVWNRKNRTMEFYSNNGFSGRMYIYDPVASTTVCNIITLNDGVYGGGDMGYAIDVNVNTGDVYVPQRYDGASSPATGSVKVYQV